MSPSRVSFDHSDDSGDMDYLLGLVKRGYSLSMDHLHLGLLPNYKVTYQRRVECIKLLIDAGFADKIFLSQDSEFGGSLLPEQARDWREKLDPPYGLLFTTRKTLLVAAQRLAARHSHDHRRESQALFRSQLSVH